MQINKEATRAALKTAGHIAGQTLTVAGTIAGSTLAVLGAVNAVTGAIQQIGSSAKTIDTIVLRGKGSKLIEGRRAEGTAAQEDSKAA